MDIYIIYIYISIYYIYICQHVLRVFNVLGGQVYPQRVFSLKSRDRIIVDRAPHGPCRLPSSGLLDSIVFGAQGGWFELFAGAADGAPLVWPGGQQIKCRREAVGRCGQTFRGLAANQ